MLRRLLELVANTGTARSTELARAMDVSTEVIEPMLQELARQGYLRLLAPGCATACARCPVRAACLFGNAARVWVLSAKGQRSTGIRPGHPAHVQ
jgi:predicted ArsR family transcriptional regulator